MLEIELRLGDLGGRMLEDFIPSASSFVSSSSGSSMSEGGARDCVKEDFDFVISGDLNLEVEDGLSETAFCIGEEVNIDCGRDFLAGDAFGVSSDGVAVDLGIVEYMFVVALGGLLDDGCL